ncbi:MAG: hypothetical protein H0Z30_02600 [Candidatus Marinimicrobia bacterium]|nr:hypothetical protein [Candidatus Neomarinimicrobiota bacterium]
MEKFSRRVPLIGLKIISYYRVNGSESEISERRIYASKKSHDTPPGKILKIIGSGFFHPEQPHIMSRHPKKGAAKWGKQFGWRAGLKTLSSRQSRKEEKYRICQLFLSNLTRLSIFFPKDPFREKYLPDSFYKISNINIQGRIS